MSEEDYDKEVLREKGYIVELSNRGGLVKHNPNFYNPNKQPRKCVKEGCEKTTSAQYCLCSKHSDEKNEGKQRSSKLIDYPLHLKDWVGRVILPGKTREECKTWALPHGKIAILMNQWIGNDETKGKKMDDFVDSVIEKVHKKISDATTLQRIHLGESVEGYMSPDDLVELTKNLTEKYFPESEYKGILIDGTKMNFKKIGFGMIPLRVVVSSFILALACEEANRGDALGASKTGMKFRYANVYMPLGSYLLLRKGATPVEARMALK